MILVIAEHNNHYIKNSTFAAISAAKELSQEIHLLIVGWKCESVLQKAKNIKDLDKILFVETEKFEYQLAEDMAMIISQLVKKNETVIYNYVIISASTWGKDILPRAACLLDVEMMSDVTKIISADTFMRPIYAGNA